MQDRRCRFGPAARIEMARRRRAGESLRQIARSMACSRRVKTQRDAGGSLKKPLESISAVLRRGGRCRSRVRGS